ncbi:NAD(+) synthase [Candidatus Uhrbacteria bacterium RIFCSPLOWO2_12_FULL_47_9]|nr:MAG: NAD(+) synthase [Candidatus Uhrbacteria bacterium RIFCSPLOWO2_12_FULL_47_9]
MKPKNTFGLVRVAVAVPRVHVANPRMNVFEMMKLVGNAEHERVQLLTFPELSLTGYTCGDLFLQPFLHKKAVEELQLFLNLTDAIDMIIQVGMPLLVNQKLFNVAVTCHKGKILCVTPKTFIPNYKHLYESRWFRPSYEATISEVELCGQRVPFGTNHVIDVFVGTGSSKHRIFCLGTEICEDVWMPIPPSSHMANAGATILTNLSASNSEIGKGAYRKDLVTQQSARCMSAYLYVSSGPWESSGDVIFDGDAMIAENGHLRIRSKPFQFESQLLITDIDVEKLERERFMSGSFGQTSMVDPKTFHRIECTIKSSDDAIAVRPIVPLNKLPFVPSDDKLRAERCEDIFAHAVTALKRKLLSVENVTKRQVVIGISGGLDSLLAFLFTLRAFDELGWDRKGILAVTMPGAGTSKRTKKNALKLIQQTGVTWKDISIVKNVTTHLRSIGHEPCWTCLQCENAQARERTHILMDLGFVIGTGDLSEIAQGWCTYNGDQQSMYNPNGDIPKTLVKYLVRHAADIELFKEIRTSILDVLATPVSPELVKAKKAGEIEQLTEDIIGPYILHDFFLWHMIRNGYAPRKIAWLAELTFAGEFDRATILKWLLAFLKRFSNAQFKRQNLPDCPKIASVSLSPRGDWRAPADVVLTAWIEEVNL